MSPLPKEGRAVLGLNLLEDALYRKQVRNTASKRATLGSCGHVRVSRESRASTTRNTPHGVTAPVHVACGEAHASMSAIATASATPMRQRSMAAPMPAAELKAPTTQKATSAAARRLPVTTLAVTNTTASASPRPA